MYMKKIKIVFILFFAFCLNAVNFVKADELIENNQIVEQPVVGEQNVEETIMEEVNSDIVINPDGEVIVKENKVVDADGEAKVEDDSYVIDSDTLLDYVIDGLPEGTVVENENEISKSDDTLLKNEINEKKEQDQANVVGILVVVIVIALFLVLGIILLNKNNPSKFNKRK